MIARLRRSDVARHGAIVFGGVAVASFFNYLYYVLVGRLVGVEGYGVVTALASLLLVVGSPAIVGQLIVARLAADLDSRDDRAALRALGDLALRWTAFAACAVFALAWALARPLATFFNLKETAPILVSAAALGLYLIVMVQRGVLQGAHRFEPYSISQAIEATVKVVAGVALAMSFGAAGALAGLIVSFAAAFGYNVTIFNRCFGRTRSPLALDRALVARVISRVGVGWFTLTFLAFYDVPLVKHAFDATSAGLYGAAALVGRAVLSAVSFVPTLIMPKASARLALGRSTLPLLGAAFAIAIAFVGVALAVAALAPRTLVMLIAGHAFGAASPLVLLYVCAAGALSLANVSAAYKMGLHRYDFVPPTVAVALAEVITVTLWHPTLVAVVTVLAIGHLVVFGATLAGITVPARGPLPVAD